MVITAQNITGNKGIYKNPISNKVVCHTAGEDCDRAFGGSVRDFIVAGAVKSGLGGEVDDMSSVSGSFALLHKIF